jgi:acetyl esterase/lipase
MRFIRYLLLALVGLLLVLPARAQTAAKVIVKRDVVYGNVEGADLVADVAWPEGQGPFPVILSVHGGRWVGSHRRDPGEGAIDVEKWAGFGLVAMTIDYRLVGRSPPPACYQDVQCAIRWLHAHADEYPIDTERIFLIGMSAGGHLVSLAATLGDGPFPRTGGWQEESNKIRGVISLSGPYDLEKLSWGNLWKPATGDPLEARRLASPSRHISDKTVPLLILHSDNDGSVPVEQAIDMAEALHAAKVRHRLSIHKNQGHMRVTENVIKESLAFIAEISQTKAEPPRRRGTAQAQAGPPDHFPHRIWAACDFEAQTPDYAWFGPRELANIVTYPGNATALGVKEKPYRDFSALMTGINPVPGPMMGKANHLYCRYYLKGATEATFQHFSLSVEDNNHIRVSGLAEGKWSDVTLNFTRDAIRNDGSPEAFQKGERMDDLKVFVGKPGDGKEYELLLDDIIFFDDDPDLPREKEPFPNRVIFLAAFDTGIDAKSKPKYWPGEFEVLTKTKGAPYDSYWGVAQAVPHEPTKGKWIRLQIKPDRTVGARTKLRFRYHLSGATEMTVQVFDVTDQDNRHIRMRNLKEGAWQWAILDFAKDARRNDGGDTPFAAGHTVDDLFFFVQPAAGKDVQLYVDEVTLFDAAK